MWKYNYFDSFGEINTNEVQVRQVERFKRVKILDGINSAFGRSEKISKDSLQ